MGPALAGFSWHIADTAVGRFDASFRIERSISAQWYTETDERHTLSREIAIRWLRVEQQYVASTAALSLLD
jgi:hypothetical protein